MRLGSRRGPAALAVRPVARRLALHRRGAPDLPPRGPPRPRPPAPGRPPCTATAAQASGCLAGRRRDVAWDGVTWGSRRGLAGAARTRRAGAVAPTAARGVARTGRSTAGRRSGAPGHLLSDHGGASLSDDVAAVGPRLGLPPPTSPRPQGASDPNRRDPPGNRHRRVEADPCAWTRPPRACAPAPQDGLPLSHTTAPQGVRTAPGRPPLPLDV